MNLQKLYEILDVLNNVETHEKKNLAALLIAINKIEQIINEEEKKNDIHTETEPEEA